jgi:hypothetical protein
MGWTAATNGPITYSKMSMDPRWNNIDGRKPKNSEINLSQCHSVNQKSHIGSPGREPDSLKKDAGD